MSPAIPDGDIVFSSGFSDALLGFVKADGTQLELVPVKAEYFTKPLWSQDGSLVYGLRRNGLSVDLGQVATWNGSRLRACTNRDWGAFSSIISVVQTEGSTRVVVNNGQKAILALDLEKCKETVVYVDFIGDPDRWVDGGSLSVDGRQLLYTERTRLSSGDVIYNLIKLDLDTGGVENLGRGLHPAWSPDDARIAFVDFDGIYVMGSDGQNKQLLVQADLGERTIPGQYVARPPAPLWSPDGAWLVYHRCPHTPRQCVTDSVIYKLEVATGNEVMLADSGYYPSWRGSLAK